MCYYYCKPPLGCSVGSVLFVLSAPVGLFCKRICLSCCWPLLGRSVGVCACGGVSLWLGCPVGVNAAASRSLGSFSGIMASHLPGLGAAVTGDNIRFSAPFSLFQAGRGGHTSLSARPRLSFSPLTHLPFQISLLPTWRFLLFASAVFPAIVKLCIL